MFCRPISPSIGVNGIQPLDERDAHKELLLHRLDLPPSPQADHPVHYAHASECQQSGYLTPLPSTFGSRSASIEPVCWQIPSQPSTPISLDGLDYTSDSQHNDFVLTPIPRAGFLPPETLERPAILMTGLDTSSAQSNPALSNQVESSSQSHPYIQASHVLSSGYISGPSTSHSYDSYDREALYTPHFAIESPVPHYAPIESPSLPWPRAYEESHIPRHYSEDPWPEGSLDSCTGDFQERGYKCSSARCRFTASSPEQLTKHQQKHLKMHHCRFPSCTRTEGFATPNDRERHEKSIHKIPGCYWKCLDSNCSSYGKEFSRRDNLKDHLRRMHPVPEGMSESEASAQRSRMADMWRFDKGRNPEMLRR